MAKKGVHVIRKYFLFIIKDYNLIIEKLSGCMYSPKFYDGSSS